MSTVICDESPDENGGGDGGAEPDEVDGKEDAEKTKNICPIEEEIRAAPADDPPVKAVRDPGMPSKEEYDEHMKVHLPFRAWCPFCVMGKAGEDPHWRKKDKKEGDKPTLCMDYKSFGQSGEDAAAAEKTTVLIMRDSDSISTFSHVVDEKGKGDGWIVEKIIDDIASLGYVEVLIKGDGEPALVQVMETGRQTRTQGTLVENPPAYDPQSNGVAEKAVDQVMGQLRALKLALESRIGI